jgi:hypothetical protein
VRGARRQHLHLHGHGCGEVRRAQAEHAVVDELRRGRQHHHLRAQRRRHLAPQPRVVLHALRAGDPVAEKLAQALRRKQRLRPQLDALQNKTKQNKTPLLARSATPQPRRAALLPTADANGSRFGTWAPGHDSRDVGRRWVGKPLSLARAGKGGVVNACAEPGPLVTDT